MAKRYRRARRYARRVYGRARKAASKMTIPIAPLAGLAAGMIQPVDVMSKGDWIGGIKIMCRAYTGFDPFLNKFDLNNLKQGLVPLLAGIATHRLASMAGINRILAKAKVPLLRV
jgi:hypothetical protein